MLNKAEVYGARTGRIPRQVAQGGLPRWSPQVSTPGVVVGACGCQEQDRCLTNVAQGGFPRRSTQVSSPRVVIVCVVATNGTKTAPSAVGVVVVVVVAGWVVLAAANGTNLSLVHWP